MYQARTKKQELRRRLLTYTIAPVVIAVGVVLLVMYTVGYRYNSADHSYDQGGLVQFISQPSGANIEVDGLRLSRKTNTRLDAAAGIHTAVVTRPGYHTWQKTVAVEPGKLLWLNYIRLIPKDIKVSPLVSFDAIDSSAATYRQDVLLVIEDSSQPEITAVDLASQSAKKRKVPIAKSLYEKDTSVSKFAIDSIDKTGRYAVIKATGKITQWLLLDLVQPERSQSISTIIPGDITKVMFFASDARKLYVQSHSTLRQVSLADRTVTAPLVSNVDNVSISSDGVVAYVTKRDKDTSQRQVGYYTSGASEPHVLRRIYDNGTQPVEFRVGDYLDGRYGALRIGDSLEIFSMQLEASDAGYGSSTTNIGTIALAEGSDFLSFSPNGRFIMSQKSSTFVTYDLELAKVTTSSLKGDAKVDRHLQWLDDHHIWSDRSGKLYVYEFDGENAQAIDNVSGGHSVMLSKNGKQIWYVDKNGAKFVIKSAELIR